MDSNIESKQQQLNRLRPSNETQHERQYDRLARLGDTFDPSIHGWPLVPNDPVLKQFAERFKPELVNRIQDLENSNQDWQPRIREEYVLMQQEMWRFYGEVETCTAEQLPAIVQGHKERLRSMGVRMTGESGGQ